MTSWLGSTVSDKLAEALAYKTAKHHGIKPEPSLLLDVSENGSNLKVRVNMPTVSLHVLKVSNQSSLPLLPIYLLPPIHRFILTSSGPRFSTHSHRWRSFYTSQTLVSLQRTISESIFTVALVHREKVHHLYYL
jgi:hypothetical protein